MGYARTIGGAVTEFGVSGKLIMNALVMYDRNTESLWSQFLGESNRDDRLPGKELVLGVGFDGGPKAFPHSALSGSPVMNDIVAGRQTLVFLDRGTGSAFAYDRTVGGRDLTIKLAASAGGDDLLEDLETGTTWLPLTGQAIAGELAGARLERLHAMNSFWFAWTDFYPETDLYTGYRGRHLVRSPGPRVSPGGVSSGATGRLCGNYEPRLGTLPRWTTMSHQLWPERHLD